MGILVAVTPSDREVSERVARCVSTMVYYRAEGRSPSATGLLAEEARSLAEWSARFDLDDRLVATVLDPLMRELSCRFGEAEGAELRRRFLLKYRDAIARQ
jgi:hypothetical protein